MGIVVFFLYVISIVYIHFRGVVRYSPIRQAMTHTNLIAPYNAFIYITSLIPNKPIVSKADLSELNILKENWQIIREEALSLAEQGSITDSTGVNDLAFNSFFRTGWKRFYLKWYDEFLPSAKANCPKTIELIKSIPSINAAMFASLPPGAKLSAHRDPYAGSLRYHLGLVTPNDDSCFINIDGTDYAWSDGGDILFDETYIHYAVNNTDQQRIILFCDVQRPLKFKFANSINNFVSNHLIKASATQNTEGEKLGLLNKLFGYFYTLRLCAKKIKKWNRTVYKTLKYFFFLALVVLVFF